MNFQHISLDGASVKAQYVSEIDQNGTTRDDQHSRKTLATPHTDFSKAFKELNAPIAEVLGLLQMESPLPKEAKVGEKAAMKKISPFIDEKKAEIISKVKCTKIIFGKQLKMDAVKVEGTYSDPCGGQITFKTDWILLENTSYGVEDNIAQASEVIKTEAEAYFLEGKFADLEMPFEDEEEGKVVEMKAAS